MKVIVRYFASTKKSTLVDEQVFDANQLTLGRNASQDIVIPDQTIAHEHLKISFSNKRIKISSAGKQHFFYQSRMLKSAIISPNTPSAVIELGNNTLTLQSADEGHLIIEVIIDSKAENNFKSSYKTSFSELNLRVRRWSWLISSIILLACLLIPLLSVYHAPSNDIIKHNALPTDNLWLAGDLFKSHQFIGDDCQVCHQDAFQQVSEQQCNQCHESLATHVNSTHHTTQYPDYADCTDCHKEHNPEQALAQYSQAFCTDCHQDLSTVSSESPHQVTDFTTHPAFNISLLKADVSQLPTIVWQEHRVALTDTTAEETSHLKFSHQQHLNPAGLKTANGLDVMQCQDCHQVNQAGEMQPITMEKDCQSCHQLTFDKEAPDRVVPHGSPKQIITMLREYYAYQYVYSNKLADNVNENDREIRRPGRDAPLLKPIEQLIALSSIFSDETVAWAESRAMQAATHLFERQACTHCHEITKTDDPIYPWQSLPVKLNAEWMPKANFDHLAHSSTACIDCHQAENSTQSADILMPDIENCNSCHGGQSSQNLIPNTCIDCHDYHPKNLNNWHSADFSKHVTLDKKERNSQHD